MGNENLKQIPQTDPQPKKTGKFFISVAILVFIQIGAGVLSAHYYAERSGFLGINTLNVLPFNVLKAIHIQTAIFWIAISWMSAGIFLAPFISGKEPKNQGLLVDILFVTMWLVGLSTLFGLYAGIKGWLPGNSWFWFGNQRLSYLQLGHFDQLALFFSLILWVFIIGRALWPALKKQKGLSSLEHLLFYSGASIAGMYVFGMFPVNWIMTSFTLTDFWRWWVVHLWVEGAFTFFSIIVDTLSGKNPGWNAPPSGHSGFIISECFCGSSYISGQSGMHSWQPYTHSYVYARSLSFYNTTLIWQWLRMPGDILFATGAAWMSWDIIKKVRSVPKTN